MAKIIAFVTGNYYDNVTIIDVTVPATPILLSVYRPGTGSPEYMNAPWGLKVIGQRYIYIATTTDDALTIADAAVLTAPVFEGAIQGAGTPNYLDRARNVAVRGNYAYVTSRGSPSAIDGGLSIFDVSTPSAPTLVATLIGTANHLHGANDIVLDGDYAYIAIAGYYNEPVGEFGLSIIDISDPAAPVYHGGIYGQGAPNFLNNCHAIKKSGNYCYLAVFTDDGLTVIDVTDPANPSYHGGIYGAGDPKYLNGPSDVFVLNNYAYLGVQGDDSLVIVNITNPAIPVLAGVIRGADTPNYLNGARGVWVIGDYAYVACSDQHSLTIIDVTNKAAPVYAGRASSIAAPWYLHTASRVFVDATYDDPVVTTQAVDNILAPNATGNGNVTGLGAPNPSQHGHCWDTSPNPTIGDNKTELGPVAATGAFTSLLTGLVLGTLYYVRAYATNVLGTVYGNQVTFTATAITTPTVTTNPATAVEATIATLNGTLDDDGSEACDVRFQYGETGDYGINTEWQLDKEAVIAFEQAITGLLPNTTYHFRAQARNSAGTVNGADRTFTTPVGLPTVTTEAASAIGLNAATLNGALTSDGGEPCYCGFEWGETIAYGTTTPTQRKVTGEVFSQPLLHLGEAARYHFRAFATNSSGTAYGEDRTIDTLFRISKAYALARYEV